MSQNTEEMAQEAPSGKTESINLEALTTILEPPVLALKIATN
jgi:hypothetical protein